MRLTRSPALPQLPLWLWMVEIACALSFTVDFAFRGLLLSDHRVDFALSLSGLATLAAVLPVLPTSFFLPYQLSALPLLAVRSCARRSPSTHRRR